MVNIREESAKNKGIEWCYLVMHFNKQIPQNDGKTLGTPISKHLNVKNESPDG